MTRPGLLLGAKALHGILIDRSPRRDVGDATGHQEDHQRARNPERQPAGRQRQRTPLGFGAREHPEIVSQREGSPI
jgi:hypothetical protein